MICKGCGNKEAYHIRSIVDQGDIIECCNACSGISLADAYVPDVFFDGRKTKFENLCDEMGRPIEIRSKRHKAEVMRSLGVKEAGDRVHGAPYGTKNWTEGTRDYRRKQFENDRPKIQETLRRYVNRARKA